MALDPNLKWPEFLWTGLSVKTTRLLSQKKDSDLANSTVLCLGNAQNIKPKRPASLQGLQQELCNLPVLHEPQLGAQEGGVVYLTLSIYPD